MTSNDDLSFRNLWPFLAVSFGIAWSVLGAYVFFADATTRWFGALSGSHPLFYLAVYSPAIAALPLVARNGGREALRRYLSRLRRPRAPRGWTLFLLFGLPIPFFVGAAAHGRLGGGAWPPASPGVLLAASLAMLVKGPVEEIGWRGFALPLLQRRMRPLWAALVLGVVWGVWHYPAFLLGGAPQSAWSFSAFFLGTLALSVLVTALYNRSGGNLLLPMLFHFQVILPLWPDGQPFDTWGFVLFALAAIPLNRDALWNSEAAHTRVLPAAHPEARS